MDRSSHLLYLRKSKGKTVDSAPELRVFSFSELKKATKNFDVSLKIGEGGFGSVYKGRIKRVHGKGDLTVVVIKKLNEYGIRGHKEFLAEVQFLGVVDCPRLVICGNLKSSNILLDESMQAKLSDFGRRGDYTHVSAMRWGTYEYTAPEYVQTGHRRIKGDINSYGVVLYGILTGRRALDITLPTSERRLVDWVKRFPADNAMFYMIMDCQLGDHYSLSVARKIAKLADRCLSVKASARPDIDEIVQVLKEAIAESECQRHPKSR